MKEIWKDIKGFEGRYRISNTGKVYSMPRSGSGGHKGMYLKPKPHSAGYRYVSLKCNGREKGKSIHRLVAEHFIPNPASKPQVNHKDGDKTNNHVSNLEWCTMSENIKHSFDNGFHKPPDNVGQNNSKAKLKTVDVINIRDDSPKTFKERKAVADKHGVSEATIWQIVTRQTWTHI